MTTDEKIALLQTVGEEIITDAELKNLLDNEKDLIAYDGFEPSGQMHIAQGLLRAININKVTSTGIRFKMLIADWHALANNKMDGDLEKIQTVGKYFIEVWKAAGMDMSKVDFVWASELVKDEKYWMLVLKIAKTNGIRRFIRAAEILGRQESMDLTLAQLMYIAMQAADIFTLGAKVTQLGMDQRKINMIAREVGAQLGFWKPVVISHHMLMGLSAPTPLDTSGSEVNSGNVQASAEEPKATVNVTEFNSDKLSRTIALKMSKSNPDSAIFMTDSLEDITRKINKAYCPEGVSQENPVLEYFKYIIFESLGRLDMTTLTIDRPEKFGGPITVASYSELESKFMTKEIHPMDLKAAIIPLLDRLIEPVRKHFETNTEAKDLLEKVQSYQITR